MPTEALTDRLPDALVIDILNRLPAKSIARFRCICKSWFSITTNPAFLRDYTDRSPNSILIQTRRSASEVSVLLHLNLQLFPPTAGTVLVSERRLNTNDDVLASCEGLLCLSRGSELFADEYYILNPLTSAQLDVVKPTCSGQLMGFYFHPTTGEYRLILRRTHPSSILMVELISLGGEAWRTIEISLSGNLYFVGRTEASINGDGILYWIACTSIYSRTYKILGFDIIKEEFKLLTLPSKDIGAFQNSSLIDMGKRLGISVIDRELSSTGEMGIDIWVLKDYENVEWEKICSVKCFNRLDGIDFKWRYRVDNIALGIGKEEIVVLFCGLHFYIVHFNLKAGKYYTVFVQDPNYQQGLHKSFLYKESLVSLDTFLNI